MNAPLMPRSFPRGAAVALLALMASAVSACRSQPFCLNCVDGAPVDPDGFTFDIQGLEVVQPDAADVQDTGPDVVDVPPSDGCVPGSPSLQTDPRNCGACGNVCMFPRAVPGCMAGRCVLRSCDFGYYDLDGNPDNGCEYACTPVPGATNDATCDNRDDDCDGRRDEDVDLCSDPRYCGSCTRSCNLPHTTATCARTAGGTCTEMNTRCEVGTCEMGYYDINGDPADGCEYSCTPTGPELCDGVDNDCNGMTDEGNPGGGAACGSATGECRRGTLTCMGGSLRCTGSVEPTPELCDNRDNDCNGMVDDGTLAADTRVGAACGSGVGDCRQGTNRCAAGAIVCMGATGPAAEVCDGRDNNCNGMIDDGLPSGGTCGSSRGRCVPGVQMCVSGSTRCVGGTGPTAELCNNLDDDCDGTVDNGFDLTNDVENCGTCGNNCSARANAFVGCTTGACVLLACMPGFVDLDRNPANGCEYACTFQSTTEICNGLDDDCDGMVDEGVVAPTGFCRTGGACGATVGLSCMGTMGWRCNYPATVDIDPMTGQPAAAETRCDNVDNNCNGAIDEAFTDLGTTCRVGTPGTACENVGMIRCATSGTGTECSVSMPNPASAEICDGRDNDCDGSVDETSLTPGTDPRFVATAWARVEPSRSCGVVPGSNGAQGRCTGDTNCDSADTTRCNAGFWCDATEQTPPGAAPSRSALCRANYWIMQYEASAPNATATARGDVLFTSSPRVVNRACSVQGVVPWTSITVTDAQAACTRMGASLCTEGQWQAACEVRTTTAATNCTYSYDSTCTTYSGSRCNGLDFDFDTAMSGDQDGLLVTGSTRISQCDANWTAAGFAGAARIFDLSGNARELTAQRTGLTDAYPVRGGTYNSPSGAIRCDTNWTLVDSAFFFPNTGFRCCYTGTTPP